MHPNNRLGPEPSQRNPEITIGDGILRNPMGHKVFVSYSTKDKAATYTVVDALQHVGVGCWIAPRDIQTGESWSEAIVRGIDACQLMVLIFSAHANASHQVRRELVQAEQRGLRILPIRIENVRPSGGLAYYLDDLQWMDAITTPFEQHMGHLTDQVRLLLKQERSRLRQRQR